MSFSIKLGNFLYKHAFRVYKPMYYRFKKRQDAFEIGLLEKHIHKNDVVLDIGANIGFYAELISRLTGAGGKVHCFEPDRQNYRHLADATKHLDNLVLNNKAAGPQSGVIKIYTSKTLNVDHRTYQPEAYDQVTEIEAVSVDDYLAPARKADFIKIDIQGFEMEAARGMKLTLAANPKLKIISEFWPYGLKKAGSSAGEYFHFLENLGFKCYLLEKNSLVRLDAQKVLQLPVDEKHYFNILALPD